WSGIGLVLAVMTYRGYEVQLTAIRGPRLARDVLAGRDRALHRGRVGVGADAVGGGADGGVGRRSAAPPRGELMRDELEAPADRPALRGGPTRRQSTATGVEAPKSSNRP